MANFVKFSGEEYAGGRFNGRVEISGPRPATKTLTADSLPALLAMIAEDYYRMVGQNPSDAPPVQQAADIQAADTNDSSAPPPVSDAEMRAELTRLREENAQLLMERDAHKVARDDAEDQLMSQLSRNDASDDAAKRDTARAADKPTPQPDREWPQKSEKTTESAPPVSSPSPADRASAPGSQPQPPTPLPSPAARDASAEPPNPPAGQDKPSPARTTRSNKTADDEDEDG